MGCKASKDSVQAIEIKDGEVRKKSGKKIKVVSSKESVVNESNAAYIGNKSTSAKSRDSGIGEMDYGKSVLINGVITEESDPNLVEDIERDGRPKTPELELVGRQFQSKSAGRMRSKAILEELEAEGLITGTKIERGGAAFEVGTGPLQPLEPLAPLRRPPPRLERMKSEKKIVSKHELEEKMKQAEERRKENLNKRSRLASQLARDKDFADRLHNDNDDEADNADTVDIVTKPVIQKADFGDGESGNVKENRTVFDEGSVSSQETPQLNSTTSTDSFFKETPTSRSNSLSGSSLGA